MFLHRYLNIVFQGLDNDCNGSLSRVEAREAFDVVLQITLTDDEFEKAPVIKVVKCMLVYYKYPLNRMVV